MVTLEADARPRTHAGIRSAAEVEAVAASFGRLARPFEGRVREHGFGGRYAYLAVGPGNIKLGTRTLDTVNPLFGLSRDEFLSNNWPMSTATFLDDEDDRPRRGKITNLSQKARNRMRQRLGTLDYTPMFRPGRQLPKMLTLTLPGEWERVAPSAVVFKRKLIDRALKTNFRRHWGYDFVGVWKLEFQRRGAPHLHILTAPPSSTCKIRGVEYTFERWLRMIWERACRDPKADGVDLDHLAKGVHIADTYGLTGTDSKRIADYFVKHGFFADKEYQHNVPDLWMGEDGEASPGRFWGYWGLKGAEGEQVLGLVETGPQDSSWGGARNPDSGLSYGEVGSSSERADDTARTHYVN